MFEFSMDTVASPDRIRLLVTTGMSVATICTLLFPPSPPGRFKVASSLILIVILTLFVPLTYFPVAAKIMLEGGMMLAVMLYMAVESVQQKKVQYEFIVALVAFLMLSAQMTYYVPFLLGKVHGA